MTARQPIPESTPEANNATLGSDDEVFIGCEWINDIIDKMRRISTSGQSNLLHPSHYAPGS